jgi:hypothetical protein
LRQSLKRQLADAEKRVARETAKTAASIAEFSAITRRLTARAERASLGDRLKVRGSSAA